MPPAEGGKMNEEKTKPLDRETVETIKNLRIIDDALFRLMASRKEVCQEILQTLLDDENLEVIDVVPQNQMISLFRGIILDALCKLSSGELCNIEMQKDDRKNDIQRVRFHASLVTANKTPKGENFSNIPNVKILYITTYDALGNGQTITHVSRCQRVGNQYLPLDDGEDIILANTEIDDSTKHSRLLKLFLKSESFYDEMFPALSEAIQFYKDTERGQEAVSEVTKKWEKNGYEKGFAQGIFQTVLSLLKQNKITPADAAKELEISEEELKELMEKTL